MSWRFFVHFTHLPLVQKALYTGVLCVLGLGYAFAMLHVFDSHAGRDGKAMLSVDDLVIAYSGSKTGTQLESALQGPMSKMLPAEESAAIIKWVRTGSSEKEYESHIKHIFDNRCVTCHNERNPHIPHLNNYESVVHTTEEDTGMDIFTLVRVSHIHLFGLTFIFFIVSSIFAHAYMRHEWQKITIVVVPFAAIAVDIFSWYLTKLFEPFAWVIIISGALMGLSFALQYFISLYQMWFYQLPPEADQKHSEQPDDN